MSHVTVASVSTPDIGHAISDIAKADADLVEIRLDQLWPAAPSSETATNDLALLTAAANSNGKRLLATLRPERQGGNYAGNEEVRVGLLAAAAKAGFAAIDLEADNQDPGAIVNWLRESTNQIVLSDHRYSRAPSKDRGLMALQAMQDAGADFQKIAFPAGSFADTLRALELNHQFAKVNGAPAAIPIGAGAMERALLPLAGAAATYGHAEGSGPAVSGQPSLSEIQSVWQKWGLGQADLAGDRRDWIAVLGNPVSHSLSPRLHNAALRAGGRPERYGALTVPDSMGAVRLLFSVAARIGLVGGGVTAPLKVHALDASQPDAAAKAIGAVNTVRFRHGGAESTNTDATGLDRLIRAGPPGPVLVLGAGGAARAAIYAAKQLGRKVSFTSRNEQRARRVEAAMNAKWIPWEERDATGAAIIVQCTTVGSEPSDESPISDIGDAKLIIEMVYAGGTTALEKLGQAAGIEVVDGVEVLLNQAADQYRFWTDEEPDMQLMRDAV